MLKIAGKHAQGKSFVEKIYAANAAAVADAAKVGSENVINSTLGAIYDENEKLVCLPTVEKAFKELQIGDVCSYAPILGLGEYSEFVKKAAFGNYCPKGKMAVIATAGGVGAIHNSIWNYMDIGDTALVADWFWINYDIICKDMKRNLATYKMFDEKRNFNHAALETKVKELLSKQERLLYILNNPGHNPTGYSLTEEEFKGVVDILNRQSKAFNKPITFVLDIAYIDFAGEKDEVRKFFKYLDGLSENILTIVCYSMSKAFTLYGQRAGAMIGISSNEEIIKEFIEINRYTCRATWSSVSRAAMKTMINISTNQELLHQIEAERKYYLDMIKKRADLFMTEAQECGLPFIPYIAGFFISIPAKDSQAVCEELKKVHVYCVALTAGVRVALCGVSLKKIKGLAQKIMLAMKAVGE
ncbi:MAG: aminotransferase class I/II-fold pyridoxal phosphate-dependent enzyme [Phascolarctobacterium sp.]|nr:aminotransferase class I/II-fold pyridoxal phosphate-dependent enzyme [Candidatus Phascolarctobacterium caballi]